jgi:hypothetical protein
MNGAQLNQQQVMSDVIRKANGKELYDLVRFHYIQSHQLKKLADTLTTNNSRFTVVGNPFNDITQIEKKINRKTTLDAKLKELAKVHPVNSLEYKQKAKKIKKEYDDKRIFYGTKRIKKRLSQKNKPTPQLTNGQSTDITVKPKSTRRTSSRRTRRSKDVVDDAPTNENVIDPSNYNGSVLIQNAMNQNNINQDQLLLQQIGATFANFEGNPIDNLPTIDMSTFQFETIDGFQPIDGAFDPMTVETNPTTEFQQTIEKTIDVNIYQTPNGQHLIEEHHTEKCTFEATSQFKRYRLKNKINDDWGGILSMFNKNVSLDKQ